MWKDTRGLYSANTETRKRVASAGGKARADKYKKGLIKRKSEMNA